MEAGLSTAGLNRPPTTTTTGPPMDPASTALVLVGFQNEYLGPEGGLRSEVDDGDAPGRVLAATVALVESFGPTKAQVVAAPIVFTPTYSELIKPVGVLAAIQAKRGLPAGKRGGPDGS